MMPFEDWYRTLAGDERPAYERVQARAFGPGQHVGQQCFATADDILGLGRALTLGPGARVLDVCCGAGGPARLLTERLGWRVVGVDTAPSSLRLAARAETVRARWVTGDATRLPVASASFDGVLMLESLAAIPDKAALLAELARVLKPGRRLALTAEAGATLPRELHIAAGHAHVCEADTFRELLAEAGFAVLEVADHTPAQAALVRRIEEGLSAERAALVAELGATAVEEWARTMRVWGTLLDTRRLSKLAIVAERRADVRPSAGQREERAEHAA